MYLALTVFDDFHPLTRLESCREKCVGTKRVEHGTHLVDNGSAQSQTGYFDRQFTEG